MGVPSLNVMPGRSVNVSRWPSSDTSQPWASAGWTRGLRVQRRESLPDLGEDGRRLGIAHARRVPRDRSGTGHHEVDTLGPRGGLDGRWMGRDAEHREHRDTDHQHHEHHGSDHARHGAPGAGRPRPGSFVRGVPIGLDGGRCLVHAASLWPTDGSACRTRFVRWSRRTVRSSRPPTRPWPYHVNDRHDTRLAPTRPGGGAWWTRPFLA